MPSLAENSAVVPRYGECAVAGLDGLFLSRRPKPMGRRRTHWDFKSGWATQSWSDLKSDQASRAGHDGCSVLAQTGCPPEQAKREFPSRPARHSHQRGPAEINRLSFQPVGCAHWAHSQRGPAPENAQLLVYLAVYRHLVYQHLVCALTTALTCQHKPAPAPPIPCVPACVPPQCVPPRR